MQKHSKDIQRYFGYFQKDPIHWLLIRVFAYALIKRFN